MEFVKSQGRETKGNMVGTDGIWRQREHISLLQVLLKLMLTYGKGGTR
jgi:hypothetical protein